MTFTVKLAPIEEEQILEETISLGFTRQKSLCIREENDVWLLRLYDCGECSARVVSNTVQVPIDADYYRGACGTVQIYDDTKLVAIILGEKVEFYTMPESNEILIRVFPTKGSRRVLDIPIVNINRNIHDYYKRDKRRTIWTRDWERHCNMLKKKLKTSSD